MYDNFKLPPNCQYDVDYVLDKCEEFCQSLCNFWAARWKFRSVSQCAGETIDAFYHRILKTCDQYEFSNPEENLIDAFIYGTNKNKAQEKLYTSDACHIHPPSNSHHMQTSCEFETTHWANKAHKECQLVSVTHFYNALGDTPSIYQVCFTISIVF